MPYQVRENLLIGNMRDAAEILQQGSERITHILSVNSSASFSFLWRTEPAIPAQEIRKVYFGGNGSNQKLMYLLEHVGKDLKFVRMAVALRDVESENLLGNLEVCLDFIEESRKKGGVLVHCFAGASRSAAVVTAYLMRSEQLSYKDAIESLSQSCESVCPNDGFVDQLKMFEGMGFKVNRASSAYKRFHLRKLGESYNCGEIDASKFAEDPALQKLASFDDDDDDDDEQQSSSVKPASPIQAYCCKKCQRIVAVQDNVVDHVPGEGEPAFASSKSRNGVPFDKGDDNECSSLFIEPLQWMTVVGEGGMEGKLSCIHCEAQLGYFNWSGTQCNCGSSIAPAFQLHKSLVDLTTS
ncbi:unnamed protein product [Cuscuta campestris]|uniref:protein-tyrosine-phosphatase n=1 Tax=Cuscuta campestris TaxID=132261 RepID=A0A484MYE1_9ASTE|nr:unnamed protein product [Cuscuta campestris]VFQ93018.1 unnamed protein product [Cuscuta campestris]